MDNVTYVYTAGSVGVLAAKITTLVADSAGQRTAPPQMMLASCWHRGIKSRTPTRAISMPPIANTDALIAGNTDGGAGPAPQYIVEAWLTVGLNNAASCGQMNGTTTVRMRHSPHRQLGNRNV